MKYVCKFFCALLILFSSATLSEAGALKVVPTKLFLSGDKKTDVLKVTNEGDEKVTVQVEAVKWSQGENGKDIYEPTDELVFFPKIFTVEKGKEALLRVGAKKPKAVIREEAFRISLQEIPVSKPGESRLVMALKLSIPVFIKPAKEIKDWAVEGAELSEKALLVKIRNSGNSHFAVGKIKARGMDRDGKELFAKDEAGWYVLPGVVRTFGLRIPPAECLNAAVIEITAEAGGEVRNTKLEVDKTRCPKEEQPMGKEGDRRPVDMMKSSKE